MSRNRILLMSLVLAALAFSTRWTIQAATGASFTFVLVNGLIAAPWLALLILSLRRHGMAGLWILVGAPLVLFWPVVFCLLWYSCRHGGDCM